MGLNGDIMKAREVYELPTLDDAYTSDNLLNYSYDFLDLDREYVSIGEQGRLVMKCHGCVRHDSRRYWELCTAWFDNQPFMIIRRAGREGDDHKSRFITNVGLFQQARAWALECIAKSENIEPSDAVGLDYETDFLRFYSETIAPGKSVDRGYDLTGY
jgi:hypothetical protein